MSSAAAAMAAAYTGPHSLTTEAETGYTLTATLSLGFRPWSKAEVFFNPEIIQSAELSQLHGLGGLSNGENQGCSGRNRGEQRTCLRDDHFDAALQLLTSAHATDAAPESPRLLLAG